MGCWHYPQLLLRGCDGNVVEGIGGRIFCGKLGGHVGLVVPGFVDWQAGAVIGGDLGVVCCHP